MGKLTISMDIFNSKLLAITRTVSHYKRISASMVITTNRHDEIDDTLGIDTKIYWYVTGVGLPPT